MTELDLLLTNIEVYNAELYSSYKPTEKIDFSLSRKNWGRDIIPEKFWIDTTKEYVTKCGYKVENLTIVLKNSNNKEVTFPIKGTIVVPREGKKDKRIYDIWTLDGRKNCNTIDSPLNLVLKK